MGKQTDQTGTEDETNILATEEESLTTNKAASAIPSLMGEGKTTLRWLSPVYGQHTVQVASNGGGKKG